MISLSGGGRGARDEADILFAFREWLKAQEGRVGKLSLRAEADGSLDDDTIARAFHLSPGIAAAEPPADLKRLPVANKRSFASRLARVIVNCLIIFALVGAAVAWLQYADDQTKAEVEAQAAKTWDLASGWLSSALHIDMRPGSDVASTPAPENTNDASSQASLQDAAAETARPVAQPTLEPAQGAPVAQPALASPQAGGVAAPVQAAAASAISPELQQKFDALQNNIADIRRVVERIASRQEQMTQDMMTLQTTQQLLAEKLAAAAHAAPAPPPSHAKMLPYPEVSRAPRSIPSPPPPLGTSTSSH
jgi:hypothetical protein